MGAVTEEMLCTQYFEKGIIEPVENEIFIDGGACDGETIHLFKHFCRNYKKIYAFEPDTMNDELCKKNLNKELDRIILLNKGCWDRADTLCFSMNGDQGSRIIHDSEQALKIETETIDHVVEDDNVTFLKLDVEGAELKALAGAENTIRRCHPRLAICIYHKPEDILEIPAYILSLSEDYDFYIRHYQMTQSETILYAVMQDQQAEEED